MKINEAKLNNIVRKNVRMALREGLDSQTPSTDKGEEKYQYREPADDDEEEHSPAYYADNYLKDAVKTAIDKFGDDAVMKVWNLLMREYSPEGVRKAKDIYDRLLQMDWRFDTNWVPPKYKGLEDY